ncbi:unnamed protein product, partial [Rotaria sordida]
MEKPPSEQRYLKDWDTKLTDDWIGYAQTAQTSHCRNINANEKGVNNLDSIWDKFWHDESFTTELISLAMIALHYGVA